MTFRPIVGWITAMWRKVPSNDAPTNGFCPIVLSDRMVPVLAWASTAPPNYCGVFLKDMTEDKAKARALEWMKPGSTELQPNMGVGQA